MKKFLALALFAFLMMMLFSACGSDGTKSSTENTIPTTTEITNENNTEAVEFSKTYEHFYELSRNLWTDTNDILSEFSKNPKITESFLLNMNVLNTSYEELQNIYFSADWNIHSTDVSAYEYREMQYHINYVQGYPMLELDYDDTWDDNDRCHSEYSSVDGWYYEFSARYADGLFEISDGIAYSVEWFSNIEMLTDTDPTKMGYRAFKVKDPSKEAYILIHPLESPDQLIRILPIDEKS